MTPREQRIEVYLKDFAQLPPQDQRVHYQFALEWIRARLIERAKEIRIDATADALLDDVDI